MPAFLAELRKRGSTASHALELLIMTAVRTDAVRRAEWHEFDLEAAVWTIPIDHLEDKRTRAEPFRVPLAASVVAMLRELKESAADAIKFAAITHYGTVGPRFVEFVRADTNEVGRKIASARKRFAEVRAQRCGRSGAPRSRPFCSHSGRRRTCKSAQDRALESR